MLTKGRIKVAPKEERTRDGITFASKAEMQRYAELRLMELAGKIKNLEVQPSFILQEPYMRDGKLIRGISYRADFRYYDHERGKRIVEDWKGMRTEVYRLKKKLLLKRYPDMIFIETGANG